MNLQITENFLTDRIASLTLEGRINAVTAPDLKTKLKHLVEDGYVMLIVDLTAVSFIDSSGLAALVSGFKAARENGGSIKLSGLNEWPYGVSSQRRNERKGYRRWYRSRAMGWS